MKAVQKGFTLIELMIVVAIIGILAAIALPAYQNYTIRAQVTEGLSLASGVETDIADYYTSNGSWPAADLKTAANASGLGYAGYPAGKYSSLNTTAGGAINITYNGPSVNGKITGLVLTVRPGQDKNLDIVWICGGNTGYAATVTPEATAANATTFTAAQDQYLPTACRS